jgi:hypothetical protein
LILQTEYHYNIHNLSSILGEFKKIVAELI